VYTKQLLALAVLATSLACSPADQPQSTVIASPARQAAVAMPEHNAAVVTRSILEQGGNAVDAAVAAAFVLAVTFPEAGNIGGGGFMLIHSSGENAFLDYREKAPLGAHRDMYLDAEGEVIEGASLVGPLAAGVPGTVAGMWAAHQRFGKLPWRDLVMPAVVLARDGFVMPTALATKISEYKEWMAPTNFWSYFGDAEAGKRFLQPELAETLERIADAGPDGFYRGETAELIAEFLEREGGLITLEDLNAYEAVWRDPIRVNWRDFELVTVPPPSSGGIALVTLLKMRDYLDAEFEGVAHNSPQYVHLIAEMEKRVFADRAEYLGDPDFVDTRMDELLSETYIARRASEIDTQAISSLEASTPGLESPDTTHFSIIDADGNAVSNTYTLNWEFGAGSVVEGGGFLLNNEMDDFSVKPGVANIFGVVGSTANEIQPGKRMLSSMTPTLLLDDDEVSMVIGTPGGSTIFTSVFQAILNLLDYDMTPLEAAGAGRFHHQLLPPDRVTYSPSRPLPDSTIMELESRGYEIVPHGWEFGDLHIIHRESGVLGAGSDPRGRGEARVFDMP
jgi:gamma-glutamyltranspeptidase/glutathione hydrolase